MKRRLNISIILSLIILIGVITISANKTEKQNNNITRNTTATAKEEIKEKQNEEMRGLWVSYLSLDMQGEDKSFDAFKEKFEDIIDKAKELKLNTLIVQVRPFCDALYDSKIFPYSHILSEAQGISPGYDALKYMCNAAHEKNLKIQAWINPLRVKNNFSTSACRNQILM